MSRGAGLARRGGGGGRGGRGRGVDRQQAIDALSARCKWAEVALVRDVLFECGWDVERGAAMLHPLAPPGAEGHATGTASNSALRPHPSPLPSGAAPEAPQRPHAPSGRAVHPGGAQWAVHPSSTSNRQGPPALGEDQAEAVEASIASAWSGPRTNQVEAVETSKASASASLEALESAFHWADPELLRDVLEAFHGDAEAAREWLQSMEGVAGEGAGAQGFAPGWRVDHGCADAAYRAFRADALKASREQRRYAKGATAAFDAGDHSTARQLSQLASREAKKAQALHAQAARQILEWRNSGTRYDPQPEL